jgi:molybdopterin-binding protein
MPRRTRESASQRQVRIGQAAEILGVSIETLRRWETDGRLRTTRTTGGQRTVDLDEVQRVRSRSTRRERAIVGQSARNRFEGVITRVERDRVAAVVEVMSGPHRLVSLLTAEAVDDLGLEIGKEVVCVVKATNVIVEVPAKR